MPAYISGKTSHIISILFSLLSTIFLFLLVLYNIPLPFNPTPAAIDAASRFWLIRVSQSGTEYGFGIWGWCEWANGTADLRNVASGGEEAGARCTSQSFWKIPYSAGPDDPVIGITLPDQIKSSLSIASFFLVFALVNSVLRTFRLMWCYFYPPDFLFKLSQQACCRYPDYASCPTYHGANYAWSLRDVTASVVYIIFQLAYTLPTLIIVGQSKDTINGYGANGESADYGIGWGFLIAVDALEIVTVLMIWGYGLTVAEGGGIPSKYVGSEYADAVMQQHKAKRRQKSAV